MTTNKFLSVLQQHQDKSLLFEYAPNQKVRPNYHITEVKNITVDAVDCGAGTDFWKETVIQLWESPSEINKTNYMSVYKALSILKKVNRIKPLVPDAEIKFEYGNESFHTAHFFVQDVVITQKQLIIKLSVTKTDCKAKSTCGIPEQDASKANSPEESCCAPTQNCC